AKSRKGCEVGGRPFPYVADHLPATKGAVATGAGGDIKRSVEGKVEIGVIARRRGLAPRPSAFRVGEMPSRRVGFADCGGLPLGFGREATLCPPAPSLGFEPFYKEAWGTRVQSLLRAVAPPPHYPVYFWLQVKGALGAVPLTPGPAGVAPKFPNTVTASFDEGGVLTIADWGARDPEW